MRVESSLETTPKRTGENSSRNFKIRSFSKAQETSNWEIRPLGSDDESNKPQSKVEVVITNSNNSAETELTNKQNNPKPEVLINSGFGFKEEIQSPIPKKRSVERIRVMNIINKPTTPARKDELSVDLNVKEDPGIHEDLKTSPVNNVNTQVYVNLDQKSLDPVQKGKERAVMEIMAADYKQRSQTKMDELRVDLDMEKDSDILEDPVNNVNMAKCVKWDQKCLDPVQKGKESAAEEIIVADFKQRSPPRMEELNVDLNVKANPDIVEDLKTEPVHCDIHKDENRLADMKRAELPESVRKSKKNEAAGGKSPFDEELRESESTNQKVSKEMEEIGEPEHEDHDQGREDESEISESNILASVYARATRPKSGVSKAPFTQDPMQKTVDTIPTIVILPSESEEAKEMERKCLQVHYVRGI